MNPARHDAGSYLCREMRIHRSHRLASGLIVLSLALLTAFLAFWLRQAFEEQRGLLQKESSHLFAEVVFKVQDSLIQNWVARQMKDNPKDSVQVSIVRLSGDSLPPLGAAPKGTRIIYSETRQETLLGQGLPRMELQNSQAGANKEWVSGLLQNVLIRVQLHDSTSVTPLIEADSTEVVNQINRLFADSLRLTLAPIPFSIITTGQPTPNQEGMATAAAPSILSKGCSYQAVLFGYRPYLFRQIAPQLFFSLFLMALITLSFLLIFRNLQQQARLADMRAGLVSNITHELKTPIATVSVAMEALENFNALGDKARTREYLDISRNELNRLSLLVDKVLNLAAFEKKEIVLQPELLDLKLLIEETLSYLKLHLEKHGALVTLDAGSGNFQIPGDRTHLTNVVYNLIDNALKYSEDKPEITITLRHEAGGIQVRIADKGIGIPAEYQPRIFDQFFRVPRGDEHNVKGYGLGLSYVAKVVEKHGGKITVESRKGEGSCFVVWLPMNG